MNDTREKKNVYIIEFLERMSNAYAEHKKNGKKFKRGKNLRVEID